MTVAAMVGLCILSCTGKQGTADSGSAVSPEDSMMAVMNEKAAALGLLQFKIVSLSDSLIADVKIMDYSSDEEPTPYTMGKMRSYYEVKTLEAVDGKPEVVEFINQWLTLDAASVALAQEFETLGDDEPLLTAAQVGKKYAELKEEGFVDVRAALEKSCKLFLTNEEDEFFSETGNTYNSSIGLKMNTENLLTIYMSGYEYAAGAAHGMPWEFAKTFDLKNLRVLTLDDIVAKSGRNAVLKMVVRQLREDDTYGEGGLNADIDFPSVPPALMEDGVRFDYMVYEVGPYAMGMPSVTIPYEKISPYLTSEVKELLELE